NTFIYTIIGTISVSIFLEIFQIYSLPIPLHSDMTLAALFAGAFIGVGLGIVFRNGGTTGGVDIIARIVNKFLCWSIGRSMFLFDLIVISTSIITYLEYVEGMYTILAVYIGSRVIDFIQEGAYAARGAMIISKNNEEITHEITEKLDRGVTIIDGTGGYTKDIHQRSEEHTSELQSRFDLVCRLLLEKKNKKKKMHTSNGMGTTMVGISAKSHFSWTVWTLAISVDALLVTIFSWCCGFIQ